MQWKCCTRSFRPGSGGEHWIVCGVLGMVLGWRNACKIGAYNNIAIHNLREPRTREQCLSSVSSVWSVSFASFMAFASFVWSMSFVSSVSSASSLSSVLMCNHLQSFAIMCGQLCHRCHLRHLCHPSMINYRWRKLTTTKNDQWLHMITHEYGWLKLTTNDYKRLEMISNDYNWLQLITDDYPWLQMPTR